MGVPDTVEATAVPETSAQTGRRVTRPFAAAMKGPSDKPPARALAEALPGPDLTSAQAEAREERPQDGSRDAADPCGAPLGTADVQTRGTAQQAMVSETAPASERPALLRVLLSALKPERGRFRGKPAAKGRVAGGPVARYRTLENGICDVGSSRFREICAVSGNGVAYVAQGYIFDDGRMAELAALIAEGGVPRVLTTRTVEMSAIAALYQPGMAAGTPTASALVTDGSSTARLAWVLAEAARAGASDLKIYQRDSETQIRVKVAGAEHDMGSPWTPDEGWEAINALFDARDEGGQHTSLSAGEFQSFSVSPGGRLALPALVTKLRGQKGFHENDTGLGTHVVLRLFYSDAQAATGSLEDLGFDEDTFDALARARVKLSGCVIVGGATGDGKSTTLIRMIDRLYEESDGTVAIVTVEDPVEHRAHGRGSLQIPVGSSGDAARRAHNYKQALMHFVRINPDVGVISEIRDADSARQILQFVASGHATYTTIHAESAGETLFRLIDMGVPPEELAKPGGIKLLMKQTLVPVLCDCAIAVDTVSAAEVDASPGLAALLQRHGDLKSRLRLRNRAGCPLCAAEEKGSLGRVAWAGYRRLMAVAETIEPDEGYFRQVLRRDAFGALHHWLTPVSEGGLGGTRLATKIGQLALTGRIDPHDALRKGADLLASEVVK